MTSFRLCQTLSADDLVRAPLHGALEVENIIEDPAYVVDKQDCMRRTASASDDFGTPREHVEPPRSSSEPASYSHFHTPREEESHGTNSFSHPQTRDVFQSIVHGRKSWKTLPGSGGEVVWPPELEAALMEGKHLPVHVFLYLTSHCVLNSIGLENYVPDDSRETRLLGRFPLRNRFLSDWIFERTGKRRTAKQVASRLQQLRDTCGGKRRAFDLEFVSSLSTDFF